MLAQETRSETEKLIWKHVENHVQSNHLTKVKEVSKDENGKISSVHRMWVYNDKQLLIEKHNYNPGFWSVGDPSLEMDRPKKQISFYDYNEKDQNIKQTHTTYYEKREKSQKVALTYESDKLVFSSMDISPSKKSKTIEEHHYKYDEKGRLVESILKMGGEIKGKKMFNVLIEKSVFENDLLVEMQTSFKSFDSEKTDMPSKKQFTYDSKNRLIKTVYFSKDGGKKWEESLTYNPTIDKQILEVNKIAFSSEGDKKTTAMFTYGKNGELQSASQNGMLYYYIYE